MVLESITIDKTWTLFLDRDGVINERLVGDYVVNVDQFRFLPGVLDAMKLLSDRFGLIIIVTNQQGIGKGLMSEDDLNSIHQYLIAEIEFNGGRIDKVYYSPHLAEENSISRKPNTGQAMQAKLDYPEIDFDRSVMVGDSLSDMEFGRKLNMVNILIDGRKEPNTIPDHLFDMSFESLFEFSQYLCR